VEALVQALFHKTALALYISHDGKFRYVNPQFQNLTGYSEEELLARYSLDLVHPEDRAVVAAKAAENLKGLVVPPYEYRLLRKDGQTIWVLENLASVQHKGKVLAIGNVIDITVRKQMEENLRESEKKYRHLCKSINEAVALFLFPDLRIAFWNKRFEEYARRIYAKNVEELTIEDLAAPVEPEDWRRAMEDIAPVLRGESRPQVREMRVKDLEGRTRIIEARPSMYKEKGEVVGVQVIISDITERKQIEEALRKSEENYRHLFEGINEAVALFTIPDFKITHWNKRFEHFQKLIIAKDTAEVTINDLAAVVDTEDWNRAMTDLSRKLAGESVPDLYEIRARDLTGKQRIFEIRTSFFQEEGHITGVQVAFTDITQRRLAEEELRQSREKYMRLYEGINEAVALFTLPDFKVSHWNRRFEDLYRQLFSKSIDELTISDLARAIPPEDWNKVLEEVTKIEKGEPLPESQIYEVRIKDLSGKTRVIEVKPSFYEEKGKVVAVQAAMSDITERKMAEEALRESEEKYSQLYRSINEAVAVFLLPDLKVGYWNDRFEDYAREVYGKDPKDVFATEIPPSVETEDWNKAMQALTRALSGEPVPQIYQLRIVDKKGNRRVIEVKPSFYKERGEVVGIQVMIADITERKRVEEEKEALLQELKQINRKLEESNKALQDFVYIASHDLREPLRKISAFGALLRDSLQGKLDEDQEENFKFMIDGATRMQEMIDDLLTYSRLTTRAKPPQPVDLNQVIEDLKKVELAALLEETGGSIEVPKPLPTVFADPSQMHQLLQNLIGNGLKFHRDGIPPRVIVRADTTEKETVRIEVEDNGIGIDEKYHNQLFTMFRRLHSREEYEGTGIGLAVCKKIVERHGGAIGVRSRLGEGSTFWFTLPRAKS
jgi:PAS domain S-box-containing protein